MPSSRGSSQLRDRTQVSHVGRWILSLPLNHLGSPKGPELLCLDEDRPLVEADCVCSDIIGNPVSTSLLSRRQNSVGDGEWLAIFP